MNVIDSNKLERDAHISLCNLRKLECAGKAAQRPTFPIPLWATQLSCPTPGLFPLPEARVSASSRAAAGAS